MTDREDMILAAARRLALLDDPLSLSYIGIVTEVLDAALHDRIVVTPPEPTEKAEYFVWPLGGLGSVRLYFDVNIPIEIRMPDRLSRSQLRGLAEALLAADRLLELREEENDESH